MGAEKKRQSKRIPLRKKYKIKKKIAEHNRKIRKAAKKNPSYVQKKLNKSVEGRIPNAWPFKEEILKNLQEKKEQRKEEKKAQQKEARQKEQERKRQLVSNPDIYKYAAESMEKDLEYTKRNDPMAMMKNILTKEPKDNSMQAYYHEFKKVLESADVIIEVLDARDPMGCRCPDVENTIATRYPNKKLVLLLNKIDLVPRHNVEKWMAYLRNSHPTVAFKSSTQKKGKISQSNQKFSNASAMDIQGSESLGADALLQLLKHYARTGSVRTAITVGIIGFPNVGKSSVINSLCRVRAAKVGATPGVTKTAQEIHLDKKVKLLDTPGIVFPKTNDVSDDIVLRNVVKLEQVQDLISPVATILKRCDKSVILSIYKVPDYETVNEFLVSLARKVGKLSRGGIPNTNAAARIVLQDWTGGKIPFYTEPPKISDDIHVAASIVTQFAPDFDVKQAQVLESLDQLRDEEPLVGVSLQASRPLTVDDVYMNPDGNDDDEDESAGTITTTSSGDNDDDEEEGDDEEEEEEIPMHTIKKPSSSNVKVATTTQTKAKEGKQQKKQDLTDEADQFNPQTNKNMKKQLKQAQKKKQKEAKRMSTSTPMADEGDEEGDYNFATDYMPRGSEYGDVDIDDEDDESGVDADGDIDIDDIDVDDE